MTERGRHSASRQSGRGQSMVEFALVLPVLLILLFGLIDGGRLVYHNSVLSQAAREGARLASVEASWIGEAGGGCNTAGGPTCPTDEGALKAHILTAANRMVAPFAVIVDEKLHLSCDPSGGAPTGSWSGSSCASNDSGNVVSVRVESTFTPITPIFSSIGIPLSASASMIVN